MDATNTALLDGLGRSDDPVVWTEYVERYRPLIVAYVHRLGASTEDAEDVAQAALLSFATAYRAGRYDRARGRLSSWLFGIVTNEMRAWARRERREGPHVADRTRVLAALTADDELEANWERQWRAAALRACLRQVAGEVQPSTMAAFEQFALRGRPAEEVAAELGVSANAVFGAKRRVLARVRELLPLMEDV